MKKPIDSHAKKVPEMRCPRAALLSVVSLAISAFEDDN
jgi:hypothetical protein